MSVNTPSPPGPRGAGLEAVEAPHLPPKDMVLKVTAYYREDGWVRTTVYYDYCKTADEEVCVKMRRYYMPAQRAPVRLPPRRARTWTSTKFIAMWHDAILQYVLDVAKVVDFVAQHLPEEAAEAVRKFDIRVSPPEGVAIDVGLKVGRDVVLLGTLPEEIYVGLSRVDEEAIGYWGIPPEDFYELIRGIAFTYMWKDLVEKAGCRLEARGGTAIIQCRGETLEVPNLLPA